MPPNRNEIKTRATAFSNESGTIVKIENQQTDDYYIKAYEANWLRYLEAKDNTKNFGGEIR